MWWIGGRDELRLATEEEEEEEGSGEMLKYAKGKGAWKVNFEQTMGNHWWEWFRAYFFSTSLRNLRQLDLTIDSTLPISHAPFTIAVPIGRRASDGLEYPLNPRFGPGGIWRPREQWPEELR